MTLVGEEVTRIKASDATREAGSATARTGSPRATASSIIIGIIMVAVTVLLENIIMIRLVTEKNVIMLDKNSSSRFDLLDLSNNTK